MGEEIFAELQRGAENGGGDGVEQGFVLADAGGTHIAFEFGKGLFDGVEVRAVGRQESQQATVLFKYFSPGDPLMGGEVAADDDVAWGQFREQLFFQVGQEHFAVHGPVDHEGRAQPVVTQGGDGRAGTAMAVRHASHTASAGFPATFPVQLLRLVAPARQHAAFFYRSGPAS